MAQVVKGLGGIGSSFILRPLVFIIYFNNSFEFYVLVFVDFFYPLLNYLFGFLCFIVIIIPSSSFNPAIAQLRADSLLQIAQSLYKPLIEKISLFKGCSLELINQIVSHIVVCLFNYLLLDANERSLNSGKIRFKIFDAIELNTFI